MRWFVPVGVLIGIFAATSWPTPPPLPGQSDKLVHYTAYASLAASVAWAGRVRGWTLALAWVIVISGIGAMDEWHQQFIPGRSMDVRDWMADTAGAVFGITLVTALARRREQVA